MGDSSVHDRRTAADEGWRTVWVGALRQYIVGPLRCESTEAASAPLARSRCARGVVRVDRCIHGGAPERGSVSLADTIGRRQKSSARVALITGAAQGLGLATAMLLARQGYELVLADLQNLDAVLGRLRAQGVEVEATQGDVASESMYAGLQSRSRRG